MACLVPPHRSLSLSRCHLSIRRKPEEHPRREEPLLEARSSHDLLFCQGHAVWHDHELVITVWPENDRNAHAHGISEGVRFTEEIGIELFPVTRDGIGDKAVVDFVQEPPLGVMGTLGAVSLSSPWFLSFLRRQRLQRRYLIVTGGSPR